MIIKLKKRHKISKRKNLDYLLIPTGWTRQRKKRVIKELEKRKVKEILMLNGNNSEEDILYLGRILKPRDKVGFVTLQRI